MLFTTYNVLESRWKSKYRVWRYQKNLGFRKSALKNVSDSDFIDRPLLWTLRPLFRPLFSHRRNGTKMFHRRDTRWNDGDRSASHLYFVKTFKFLVFSLINQLLSIISASKQTVRMLLACFFVLNYFIYERYEF